jgi:hypothetical protein
MFEKLFNLLERLVVAFETIAKATQKSEAGAAAPSGKAKKEKKKKEVKPEPPPEEEDVDSEEEEEESDELEDEAEYTKAQVEETLIDLRATLAVKGGYDLNEKEDKKVLLRAIYSFVRKYKAKKLAELDPACYGSVIRDVEAKTKKLPKAAEKIRKLVEGLANE